MMRGRSYRSSALFLLSLMTSNPFLDVAGFMTTICVKEASTNRYGGGLLRLTSVKQQIRRVPLAAAGRTTSTTTRLYDSPEPLAEEGTWQAFLDEETTGLIYYFDSKTGESLWEPPTDTFPQVRLPRKKQRLAEDLRKDYRKARQAEEEEGAEKPAKSESKLEIPNWIEGILDGEDKTASTTTTTTTTASESAAAAGEDEKVQELAERGKGWLNSIFGESKDSSTTDEGLDEKQVEVETKQQKGKEKKDKTPEPQSSGAETAVKNPLGGFLDSFAMKPSADGGSTTAVADKKVQQEKVKAASTTTATTTTTKSKPKPTVKEEPKIQDFTPKPIKIEIGSFVLPHPAKVRWGGEDAVFSKGRTFGVFDGVSGADKLDGVPLYSRTLADEMKRKVGTKGLTIQEMTSYLTEAAAYADSSATGASTAVVASIGENGFLRALNVGDSYCYVIRGGRITAKTREISHYWECPYQLSEDSPDRPKDGTKLNVELIPGDLVLMGSDGIFDNVSDDMLLNLISKSGKNVKPGQLARKICDLSRKQSLDRKSNTPYGKQAQRRGDADYKDGLGGKIDDSSCVVVLCK